MACLLETYFRPIAVAEAHGDVHLPAGSELVHSCRCAGCRRKQEGHMIA
jgi:hypothetical protein